MVAGTRRRWPRHDLTRSCVRNGANPHVHRNRPASRDGLPRVNTGNRAPRISPEGVLYFAGRPTRRSRACVHRSAGHLSRQRSRRRGNAMPSGVGCPRQS